MATTEHVAAYCRVSTLEQKKKGLGMDIQVRDVTAFAEAQNLVISRFYRDEAQSGAAENRKQLNKLLRACERGRVRIVIIPALDRLSRSLRIAENLFHRFEKLDIKVLIADMPGYDSQNRRDVLVRQIPEAIAEENRKDIIERLLKGRQERVRQGKPPGGTVPYGYRKSGKALQIDVAEAAIVSRIFDEHRLGFSAAAIAKNRNAEGQRLRNGGHWRGRQVLAILGRCDLYEQGVLRYGKIKSNDKHLILLRNGGPS